MSRSDTGPNQTEPNDDSSTERTIGYSYGGDFVINSSASAGAWIASTYTMFDVDQVSEQEVSA